MFTQQYLTSYSNILFPDFISNIIFIAIYITIFATFQYIIVCSYLPIFYLFIFIFIFTSFIFIYFAFTYFTHFESVIFIPFYLDNLIFCLISIFKIKFMHNDK